MHGEKVLACMICTLSLPPDKHPPFVGTDKPAIQQAEQAEQARCAQLHGET